MDSCHFAHSSKLSFVVAVLLYSIIIIFFASLSFYGFTISSVDFVILLFVCTNYFFSLSDYWIVVMSFSRIGWGDGGVWSDLIYLFYLCLFVMGPHCDQICISSKKSNITSWLRSVSFFHVSFLVLESSGAMGVGHWRRFLTHAHDFIMIACMKSNHVYLLVSDMRSKENAFTAHLCIFAHGVEYDWPIQLFTPVSSVCPLFGLWSQTQLPC